jgi:hypothetical protein
MPTPIDPTLPILHGFLETALWATHDYSTPEGGEPMDANYDVEDIHPDTRDRLYSEVEDFYMSNTELLDEWHGLDGMTWERIGHDLFLTREHHGAGFWDWFSDGSRKEEMGSLLTDAAHTYGEVGLYVGDDGKIYAQ